MARARIWFAFGVSVLWMISYTGSIVTGNFTGFELTTPVMLVVASWLLGSEIRRRNGDR